MLKPRNVGYRTTGKKPDIKESSLFRGQHPSNPPKKTRKEIRVREERKSRRTHQVSKGKINLLETGISQALSRIARLVGGKKGERLKEKKNGHSGS